LIRLSAQFGIWISIFVISFY